MPSLNIYGFISIKVEHLGAVIENDRFRIGFYVCTLLSFKLVDCCVSTRSHMERYDVSIETGVNVKLGGFHS